MFRFASGQLVLVALTACVSGQSSGFLKSQGIFPVVSVLQQIPTQTQPEDQKIHLSEEKSQTAEQKIHFFEEQIAKLRKSKKQRLGRDPVLAAANAGEDAVLKRTWDTMVQRHTLEQQKSEAAMNEYDTTMTKRYSCTAAHVREDLKKNILSQRRVAKQTLYIKQQQEGQLYMRRLKCMQQVPGDESLVENLFSAERAQVTACMKAAALRVMEPVAQESYQGLDQSEKEAVKKQTDRWQEMQQQAINDTLEGVFRTEQKSEQKEMQDTWEKYNKYQLQHCGQSTDTEEEVVPVKLNEAKAVDVKQKVVKVGSQKAQLTDALADAKKVMAEASAAVAKKYA